MDARLKVIVKVVSLANVTVENGATEAEMATATELARRLIAKHQLEYSEVTAVARAQERRRAPTVHRAPPPPQWKVVRSRFDPNAVHYGTTFSFRF